MSEAQQADGQSLPEIAYNPSQVARYTLEEIARRRQDPKSGVPIGLETVAQKLRPLRPGELVTILGRPSHYKSGLAQWWARHLAQSAGEGETTQVVAYVTAEMAIEELSIYDLAITTRIDVAKLLNGELADAEWGALQGAAMDRASLPLWLLGHSLATRRKRVRLSIWTIERALYWIEDHKAFRPRIIFLDYLNLLQSDRKPGQEANRRIDLSEIVQCAKDMALNLGCPVVMLAQAHRRCDERAWKLPEMRDAMETAAIEQYSDKVLSVWYPKVTEQGDTITTPDGEVLPVNDNLLILGLMKQKNGPAGGWWPLYVDPTRNLIGPMARTQTYPYHEAHG